MGACRLFPEGYRPRQPRKSPLYRLLKEHFSEFKGVYKKRFQKRYGFWRPVVEEVVEKFLACGDLHYGFARVRCDTCGHDYLLAFSCKCRSFCPSCSSRRGLDLGTFLQEQIRPAAERGLVCSLGTKYGRERVSAVPSAGRYRSGG